MRKILLVDDEKDIVEMVRYNLEKENYFVITAYDGEEALSKVQENPDLVILDVMMPKLNGFEVCKRLRDDKKTEKLPVIFLTAKAAEADEINGLNMGANDYIVKPISPQKLIARVQTIFRNMESSGQEHSVVQIENGPITINREKYLVYINSEEVIFPKKEFELLFFLMSFPGKVLNRELLLKEVWGSDVYVGDRTIDVHVRKIREKLGRYSDAIETIKGVGYRIKVLY
ncbi:MAG: response regulator transcription factor [Ignavibacteriales bacterium]|nr:Alkaline phosphatase synthesis transcriptional regulatory protein PhoP [Ignavibacteriaceae bacterium]MCK6612673.1 response regulator transcription factor [Ignavibacteriaceae bacterium]QOJ29591.1 MAG: response regulator transcription factor [Ignavibacteriales bacterium]